MELEWQLKKSNEVAENETTLETRLVHLNDVTEYFNFKKFYASFSKELNQSDLVDPVT
jgi:hypothetical protein